MSLTIQHYSASEYRSHNTRHPELTEDEVHVWHASVTDHSDQFDGLLKLLSADENLRADRYRFEKDRRQFAVARGLLRELLGTYLELTPEQITFDTTEFGKPFLKGSPLFFNLAHSGDHILFAFSCAAEVGVDVEDIHSRRNPISGLAGRICTSIEQKLIQQFSDPTTLERSMFRLWTAKEAYLKALGTGLQIEPNQIEISENVLKGESSETFIHRTANPESRHDNALHPFPEYEERLGCSAALAILKEL